jgi:hypothetical protein
MKKIDLHVHTTASDGVYTPRAIIDRAVSEGICALAVTDHDTVGGLPEAAEYADSLGFDLIPGIEFSIDYSGVPGASFHLLGLNIDFRDEELIAVTGALMKRRSERISRIVEDLAGHGIEIPEDEIVAEAAGESMGRPHVARVLMRYGHCGNMEEAFKNFLVPGKPGYVKKEKIALDEALRLIKKTGGVALIAHPISLNFGTFKKFVPILESMIKSGVEGIEAYSSMHDASQVSGFLDIAAKYGLLISGGSDFHGDKHEKLGFYGPINPIPYEILSPLKNRFTQ